jgi:hypothetical protein
MFQFCYIVMNVTLILYILRRKLLEGPKRALRLSVLTYFKNVFIVLHL